MLGRQLADPRKRPVWLRRRRCREVVAELHLRPQAACACPVDRAIDDDAMQPRPEGAPAVEAIQVPDRGKEGLLRDVLGSRGVAGDEPGGPEGARPVLAKEPLEVGDRPLLGTPDPGALRHPPTVRRSSLTRSIRLGDLSGSGGRIQVMRRVVLALLAAVTVTLPGAAQAAACSPLSCAPSQFTLANGTLLGFRDQALGPVKVVDLQTGELMFRLPGGYVGGNLLVHKSLKQLVWFDARTGEPAGDLTLATNMRLGGVSQDGSRAVGFRLTPDTATTVVIATTHGVRELVIPGRQWDFDALSGNNLFLIRYLSLGGYQVRLLDLATGKLAPKPLKDPHESGTIWGQPFSRLSSPDGRFLFTLYITSNGAAMIHELDLKSATARCIDLHGTGDYVRAASWAMVLAPGGQTLWAIAPGYGRVVAIDVNRRVVTHAFRIDLPTWV